MNRRALLRNSLWGAVGLSARVQPAVAREFPPNFDASKELARPDWKPVFLDAHQNETLIVLSDLIIPATDTPGAKEAQVNRFLDLLMSIEAQATQREFVAALSYIDGETQRLYKSAFVHLTPQQQVDYLTSIAYPHTLRDWGEEQAGFIGNQHFEKMKGWISGAYYSSPIGLKALGWDGTFPHGALTDCGQEKGPHQGTEQNPHTM